MNQLQQEQYTGKGGIYQQLTLPISENILIEKQEPVYVANAQLEELDYRKLYQAYSSRGRKSAAEPRIMFKLLVYGYMCGIYSTRKLELACRKNIDFIWLLQGEKVPDYSSFARFRSGKAKDAVEDLFYQFVKRLAELEETEYEEVFIDGTKIESIANRYTFVWKTGVEKNLAKLKEKAKEVFNEYGGKGNLTRKKLRELADKQLPPNAEFVHGIGKRKSEWQKRYGKLDSLWTKWTEYEDKLFAIGNNRRSMSKTDKDATFMRMKEDHMGNGQLKPAYNVQFAVNSEYITGVAAFSNRTDSGTLIPFLNHIQRMQSRSYRDIVADAGYESVRNYLYLEQNGQNCFIKPISYEKQKTKKFKSRFWRAENMEPLEHEDGFLCAGGRKLLFTHSSSKKENGFVTTTDYYRCKDCSGCELRSKCFKSSDEVKNKEIRMCTESAEHRKIAFENLLSERGALLRMNRSIQKPESPSSKEIRVFMKKLLRKISKEIFPLRSKDVQNHRILQSSGPVQLIRCHIIAVSLIKNMFFSLYLIFKAAGYHITYLFVGMSMSRSHCVFFKGRLHSHHGSTPGQNTPGNARGRSGGYDLVIV